MIMTYLTQPPKRYTFEQPKLKDYVERWCRGRVLNLFAGTTRLKVDEVRVDLDQETNPDYCMDAEAFVDMWIQAGEEKFDTIVLDPPYNLRKAREKYEGRYIGLFTRIKNKIPQLVKEGGRVIILGYDTVGMSKSRGFTKVAVCVICHNGDHNDTLCVIEEKR